MGSQSSSDEYDYPATRYYSWNKKLQYHRKLRKINDHILEREEIKTYNFVCRYFRILEQEASCRIVNGIRQIIVKYCSFDMKVTLNIWDTSGQERFHALAPIYYRDSDGVILVYDITNDSSASMLKNWSNELKRICGNDVVIVIAGNKIDLKLQSQAAHSNATNFAADINTQLFQVSAKTDKRIDELFECVALKMLNNTTVNNNDSLKIIMLGEGRVGKTSIVRRYVLGVFADYASTYTGNYLTKDITVACSLKRYIRSITFDKNKEMLKLVQQDKQEQEHSTNESSVSLFNPMSIGKYVYNQYQEWFD